LFEHNSVVIQTATHMVAVDNMWSEVKSP